MVRFPAGCCAFLVLLTLPLASAQAKQTPLLSTPAPRTDPAYRDREVILQSGIFPRTTNNSNLAPPTFTREDFLLYTAEVIRALRKLPVEDLKQFHHTHQYVFPALVRLLNRFQAEGSFSRLHSSGEINDFHAMQNLLFIPLDHWAYSALDNIQRKPIKIVYFHELRDGLSREQFAEEIAELVRRTSEKPSSYFLTRPEDLETLQRLVKEFAPELQRLQIDTASLLAQKIPPDVYFFDETNQRHWAYKSVKQLGRMGILRGYPNGAFRIKTRIKAQ